MFWHERTRITLCRLGFIVGCLLPTAAVLAWSLSVRRPGHLHNLERSFTRHTGVPVTIGQVSYPRRGVLRCLRVELRDPDSDKPLVRVPVIELSESANVLRIVATDPVVDEASSRPVAEWLTYRLRGHVAPATHVRLTAAHANWRVEGKHHEMVNVNAVLDSTRSENQASLAFQWRGHEARSQWVRMRLTRSSGSSSPASQAQFHTGDLPIRCRLLTALGYDASWFGPDAAFSGSVWCDEVAGEWRAQLVGTMNQVRLESLLGANSPHALTGTATVQIAPRKVAYWRGGRLEQLSATVIGGPGEISYSLLSGAAQRLKMPNLVGAVDATTNPRYPYEQLAMFIALDRTGLVIRGAKEDGAILRDQGGVLVQQPTYKQSIQNLIALLSPPTGQTIPANDAAQRLAQRLPIPQPTPAGSVQPASASGRQSSSRQP